MVSPSLGTACTMAEQPSMLMQALITQGGYSPKMDVFYMGRRCKVKNFRVQAIGLRGISAKMQLCCKNDCSLFCLYCCLALLSTVYCCTPSHIGQMRHPNRNRSMKYHTHHLSAVMIACISAILTAQSTAVASLRAS